LPFPTIRAKIFGGVLIDEASMQTTTYLVIVLIPELSLHHATLRASLEKVNTFLDSKSLCTLAMPALVDLTSPLERKPSLSFCYNNVRRHSSPGREMQHRF